MLVVWYPVDSDVDVVVGVELTPVELEPVVTVLPVVLTTVFSVMITEVDVTVVVEVVDCEVFACTRMPGLPEALPFSRRLRLVAVVVALSTVVEPPETVVE